MLDTLRQFKHAAWLTTRRARQMVVQRRNNQLRSSSCRAPFVYKEEDQVFYIGEVAVAKSFTLPVNHLLHSPKIECDSSEPVPPVLYCMWTGDNELTPKRRKSLEALRRQNHDIELRLITPESLEDNLAPGHPLHPAYQYLSTNHRSDYLRAYFMHHYGGAYADIKPFKGNFTHLISMINETSDSWGGGAPERDPNHVSAASGPLGDEQRRNFALVPYPAAFAFRPRTPLTSEWLAEVERRLNYFSDLLEARPAVDPFGMKAGYPVPWNSLHGSIFGPLCLKYHERLVLDESIEPDLQGGYR